MKFYNAHFIQNQCCLYFIYSKKKSLSMIRFLKQFAYLFGFDFINKK